MSPALAIANLGAEESEGQSSATERTLAPLAELFRAHVERAEPVFSWLPRSDACVAWLNSAQAEQLARERGLPLFGASSEVTRACHDKAFAQRVAREQGLEPAVLRGCVEIFEPADLEDPERVCERIRACFERQVPAAGLTLKPRIGTSGRGRVPLKSLRDLARVPLALPRLQRAGGAVLEPWLERSMDLSASLYVAPSGEVEPLGSAQLLVTQAGVYRGHRGWLDAHGTTRAGIPEEQALCAGALRVARAAAARGYTGPCGVDGFSFRSGGRSWLRPVVELNARFTLGILVIACLRDQLGALAERGALRTDRPLAFRFDWPGDDRAETHATATLELSLPSLGVAAAPTDAQVLEGMRADGARRAPRLRVAPTWELLSTSDSA